MGTLTVLLTPLSPHSLHARCIYNATELLPLSLEVAVPPTAAPLAQPGPLQLQLRIATGEPTLLLHPLLSIPTPVPPILIASIPPPPIPLPSIPVLPIPVPSTPTAPCPAQPQTLPQMRATAPTTLTPTTRW